MKKLSNLKGAQLLSKEAQQYINGGGRQTFIITINGRRFLVICGLTVSGCGTGGIAQCGTGFGSFCPL